MRQKTSTTSIILNLDINKFILNLENDTLILNESVSPDIAICIDYYLQNDFNTLIVKENLVCDECGSKLSKNGTDKLILNKKKNIKLQKYKCSNKKCQKYYKVSLLEFIDKSCNYSKNIRQQGLELDSIDHSSYDKKSEIIEKHTSVKIPRSTIYYHEKSLSKQFIINEENKIQEEVLKSKIQPSGIYHYDEQYEFINTELYLRMTILDNKNNLIINEKLVSHKEFNKKTIQNFLEKSLDKHPIKAIITDGNNYYPSIIESLGAIRQNCAFHKMQNLMTEVIKKLNKYQRQIKNAEIQIEKNTTRIKELKKENKGKTGRIHLKDKKKQKRQEKIRKLEKETRTLKDTRWKNKAKIKELEKYVKKISLIFKSKTIKTAKKRFQELQNKKDELPKVISSFIKKLSKNIEKTLQHIIHEEIPKTNNKIECYYKTTMPRYIKKIFRTKEGFIRQMKLQQIRWTKRNVLNTNQKKT
ncbi:hypothetical protein [Methanobrevibacter sp. DSM 116169]|uniref:hypothetical protein n=1 Tax=Methanobrevibacter sp. DSM 116169 TaxID=3242727 RepID=UPI0038FC589E